MGARVCAGSVTNVQQLGASRRGHAEGVALAVGRVRERLVDAAATACGSSSAQTFDEVERMRGRLDVRSRSSSPTLPTASRIALSCSANRSTSSSVSSSRASRATCSTSSREIAIAQNPVRTAPSETGRQALAAREPTRLRIA